MNYPLFCQNDSRWKFLKIPQTNLTIGKYGCCICDLAMLSVFVGKKENPATLLPKLSFYHGLIYWQSLTSFYQDIKFLKRKNNPSLGDINDSLKKGNPVIVKVNISKLPFRFIEHWIILWQPVSTRDFIVGDPAKCRTASFNLLYGKQSKIYTAVFYQVLQPVNRCKCCGQIIQ